MAFNIIDYDKLLCGAIDMHLHPGPDSFKCRVDALEAAKQAKLAGMKGLVLKNHFYPTAPLAMMVNQLVPDFQVFGSVCLDDAMGGLNVHAVAYSARTGAKVVWMPTFDAENQVRFSKGNRPFAAVSRNGQLLPEVKQVIGICARHDLLLETGHSSASEALLILREGQRQGVKHMVVTHAMIAPIRMTLPEMQGAVNTGAFIEFVYNALIGPNKEFTLAQYAAAIRAVGPAHCILSSDLGQAANPLHPDGLTAFFAGLRKEGISQADIDLMSKANPARALGLQ